MSGYLNETPLEPHAWLDTGDLGRIEDGFLFITGRAKSTIVLGGGKKVQPEELEPALEGIAGIDEACIVGAMHNAGPLAGTEEVCAVVVSGLGQTAALEAVRARLASFADYKRPTRAAIHPGPLPRTAARKIRRHEIQEWLQREKA